MSEISELTHKLIAFRDARDWKQFHNPKDLAVALSIESARLDSKEFEKTVMFNPLNLVTGIEPSNDPILLARPAAYGVSYARRLSNQSGK